MHTATRAWSKVEFLDGLLLLLLPLALVVDIANGFLALQGIPLPVSIGFKGLLLILLYLRLLISFRFQASLLLAMFLLLVMPIFIGYFLNFDFGAFFDEFSIAFRVSFNLGLLAYLLLAQPPRKEINFALKVLLVSLLANTALGVAGFGYQTYEAGSGIGVKGFFYAGNELSVVVIALAYYAMFSLAQNYSGALRLLIIVASVIVGLSVGTKSAMLGVMLLLALYIWVHNRSLFWFALISAAVTVAVASPWIAAFLSNSGLLDRFLWIYDEYGLLTLIFSSRNLFLADVWHWVSTAGPDWAWITGWGIAMLGEHTKPSVEIDLFDMYFMYGLAGLIAFIAFFTMLWKLLAPAGFAGLAFWGIIFVIAFFAGHVVYSGGPAVPLCLVAYYCGVQRNSLKSSAC